MATTSSHPAQNDSRSPSPPSSNDSPPSSSSHSSPESSDFLQSQVDALGNLSAPSWGNIPLTNPSVFPPLKSNVIWDPSNYGAHPVMDESEVFSEFMVQDVYE